MGDRVRVGELLAAIGSIGLALLLAFGAWFDYESPPVTVRGAGGGPGGEAFALSGAVGSRYLGWFALLLAAAAAFAGLIYLARVLTSKTSERPMLQAPVAYAFALIALIALTLRLLFGNPTVTLKAADVDPALGAGQFVGLALPTDVALGGWLGLASVFLIVVGTWHAMADERTKSKGARARTEALLAGVTPRAAPLAIAGSHPSSDASVVADGAAPTDPSEDPLSPPNRPSGGPA